MWSDIVPLLAAAAQEQPPHPRAADEGRPRTAGPDAADPSPSLQVHSLGREDVRRVDVSGELDIAGRDLLAHSCGAGTEPSVVVDLSDLVFMDCCGYSAIVQAHLGLDLEGRTLTLVGPSGQPARLMQLIQEL